MASDLKIILGDSNLADGMPSEELLPLVYDELRALARARLRGEACGQTVQATALVHEAWLRICGNGGRLWNDRAHFFRVAALEMRRVLVDNARRKARLKRGAGCERLSFEGIELAESEPGERVLLIHEALERLELEEPKVAKVVELKFFGGLTNHEIAAMEGVAERTVERHWAYARARLFDIIRGEK